LQTTNNKREEDFPLDSTFSEKELIIDILSTDRDLRKKKALRWLRGIRPKGSESHWVVL